MKARKPVSNEWGIIVKNSVQPPIMPELPSIKKVVIAPSAPPVKDEGKLEKTLETSDIPTKLIRDVLETKGKPEMVV